MEGKIKKYFSIDELCYSNTAEKNNIKNTPNKEEIKNLQNLIDEVLQPLRVAYNKPIIVTSGFRCAELNKLLGGKPNSQHLRGQAADIVPKDIDDLDILFELCKNLSSFDQLLYEKSKNKKWIHISYKDLIHNRNQVINNYLV